MEQHNYVDAIRRSGLTIYDQIEIGDPNLWIPTPVLESLLDNGLRGLSLANLENRARSKALKQHVCRVLGYPVPNEFEKTQPRFFGQCFDTYVQKSNNLQVHNEELSPSRRYVIVRVAADGTVSKVRAITGEALALLDHTGTLTGKYQARCLTSSETAELAAAADTAVLKEFVQGNVLLHTGALPDLDPKAGEIYSIVALFDKLQPLVSRRFENVGIGHERLRGDALHRLVCSALGYAEHRDNGQFPDVRNQLLEIKFQTSPTIDLGIVLPNSTAVLDISMLGGKQIRHCDVRYAVFFGKITPEFVDITHLILTTGESFFDRFQQMGGNVLNQKLQIKLPPVLFD